jgi:hypothetical protein
MRKGIEKARKRILTNNYRRINLLGTTLKLAIRIIIEKIGENNKDIEVGGSCTGKIFGISMSDGYKEGANIARSNEILG